MMRLSGQFLLAIAAGLIVYLVARSAGLTGV
jgi:hypothetical protein